MIELSYRHLEALSDVLQKGYPPHKIKLENVATITTPSGETITGEKLLVATLYFDDQRDGSYESRYMIGSALTGGKALRLND